jgi:hypothetical protein
MANPKNLLPQFPAMPPVRFEFLSIVLLYLFSAFSGPLVRFKKFDSHLKVSYKYNRCDQIHRNMCIVNVLSSSSVQNNKNIRKNVYISVVNKRFNLPDVSELIVRQ